MDGQPQWLFAAYCASVRRFEGGGAVQLAGGAIQSAAMFIKSDDILGEEQAFIDYLRDKDSEDFKPKKKIKK